jgi:hypothetical protein
VAGIEKSLRSSSIRRRFDEPVTEFDVTAGDVISRTAAMQARNVVTRRSAFPPI